MTQYVTVVMSNDFPHRVFADNDAAIAYCTEQNKRDKEDALVERRARIFYGCYRFEVQEDKA